MSWPIDNPSIIYFLLISTALGLLAGWWVTRRRSFLIGLGAVAGLAALFFLLTLLVDTDRKRIKRSLQAMMQGVRERNLDKTFAQLSDDFTMKYARSGTPTRMTKPELRSLANSLNRSGGVSEVVFNSIDFEKVEEREATVSFMAKPFGNQVTGAEFCNCQARFRLDPDGKWRMTRVTLIHPVQSKELLELPIP
jgi:hypothetical protein